MTTQAGGNAPRRTPTTRASARGFNDASSAQSQEQGNRKLDRYSHFLGKFREQRGVRPPGGGGGPRKPPPAPPKVQASGGRRRKKPPSPGEDFSPDGTLSQKLRQNAEDLMDGKNSRFSDERVQMMKDQMFESTIGRVQREVRSMDGGLARRGMFRSGISARAEKDIRLDAMRNYSRGVKDIMLKKMDAEFDDKIKGMGLVQTWLTQKQNYDLGKERNQIAREQIAASMAAAQLSAQVSREGIRAANSRARAALLDNQAARDEARAERFAGTAPF